MKHPFVVSIATLALLGFVVACALALRGVSIPILEPSGVIALRERSLMIEAVLLMLIVIVPVICLALFFAWHYRAGNKYASYTPEWEHSVMDELVWWAVPLEVILVLGALTWTSTHNLDPRRSLDSAVPPMTIEVVALPWKWLFIYPQEGIATLNYVEFPAGTPVDFKVTAQAPMNSFWIPALGGQIYAMDGMVNDLNLETDTPGTFAGSSANYSGDGFAGMKFDARAVSESEYRQWVAETKSASATLDQATYTALAEPGTTTAELRYGSVPPNLFSNIIEQFMPPASNGHHH